MLPDRCASSISLQHQRNPFGHRELFALAVACSLLRHIERQTEVFIPPIGRDFRMAIYNREKYWHRVVIISPLKI